MFTLLCVILQAKYSALKRQHEKMEMEVMESRLWYSQAVDGELDDDEGKFES